MQAQDVTKGNITGIVKDPSGTVIPGATVKLTSPHGDKTTTTDAGGAYGFIGLVAGTGYNVEVDQSGFAPAVAKDLTVGINQTTTYDFTLQIGTTATTVEISSTSNAIDLSSTTIGGNFDDTLLKNVPVGTKHFGGHGDGAWRVRQRRRGRRESFHQRRFRSGKRIRHQRREHDRPRLWRFRYLQPRVRPTRQRHQFRFCAGSPGADGRL